MIFFMAGVICSLVCLALVALSIKHRNEDYVIFLAVGAIILIGIAGEIFLESARQLKNEQQSISKK
jgi:cytochrome c biogenesis protein CcdA